MMSMTATAVRYSPVLILAAIWEATTRVGLVSELILPPLSAVAVAFVRILLDDLWLHTAKSLYRGAAGLGFAVAIGILAGVTMAWYRPVRIIVDPLVRCLYPMPKSALIPLTIMWIGLGDASKISLIFIGCLLPVIVSAFNATRGVEDVLIWSARGMGASEREVLWEVALPAALPEILNGVRTSLALSFILLISGELIIANNGVGYLIAMLGEGGDYAGMFAGVVTITAIGFLADRGFVALTRRLLAWRE
jgi:ABC-type nitrate/sulfonate/bicarbonate transport system permease component